MIKIIYPEVRFVSEEKVISWAKDEVANNLECYSLELADKEMTIERAKEILSDSGSVTFAKGY